MMCSVPHFLDCSRDEPSRIHIEKHELRGNDGIQMTKHVHRQVATKMSKVSARSMYRRQKFSTCVFFTLTVTPLSTYFSKRAASSSFVSFSPRCLNTLSAY